MAISAVMAAVSTAGVALAGGVGMLSIASIGLTGYFGHFLISTAMGAALNALTPKPSVGSSRGYSLTGASGSALDHQIIYGTVRVGGVRVYDASTGNNNEYLHRILAFAGHRIDSYQEIYLNDELLTLDGSGNVTSPAKYNGYVTIKQYLGLTNQQADTDLINETSALTEGVWTSSHRLRNIAYLYIRLKYNADVFPNGIPSFSATIKGKLVYDPDTATTAWSDNPALCLRDYFTSAYGLSQPTSRISDTHVSAAKAICNQTVDGEKRYTCNGVFTTGLTPKQIISDLTTSMGGLVWYSGGYWKMKAAAWTTPTITLNESDLRSSVSISTRFSRRDNFNTVKGKFRGPESNWQEADYPSVTDPAFISADNDLENVVDLTLPFTSSSKTAQRVAKIFLFRNREQITLSASWGLKAFQVEVGDIVNISLSRYGWTNKPFEVTSWSFGLTDGLDLQAQMTLREISEEVFEDVPGAVFESNNTNLPSAFYVPTVGVALSSTLEVINENATNVVYINVTSMDPSAVERVEVQFKKSSESTWSAVGTGDLGLYKVINLEEIAYDFRARAYSFLGVRGDWETYNNYVPTGSSAVPSNVADFAAQLNGSSVNLSWSPISDADLSFYRIRHTVDETGAAWGDAVTYVDKVSRPGTSITVPAKPGTYMIKAYDKTGHNSNSWASVVVPAASLEAFTTTLTDAEHPTFPGTKTGCSVTSSNLRITSVAGAGPFSATYDFSGYLDTGAVKRFRARVDVDLTRFDTSSGLWDNIPGNFDDLSGLFDTFTGGGQFDDVNVVCFIRTTSDNPAGTPTWSAWRELKVGDFYARAAQFRVVLYSNSTGITPSISALTAIVQYN